jgi:drug/metabolite transporter (DMT)-like permease
MSLPAVDAPDALSGLIPSRTVRGFFVAVLSGLFFVLLNSSVKELTQEMPPLFVAWGRWVAGIVLLGPFLAWRVGMAGLATRDLKLHCLRGLFHTSGYALWYEAVSLLPLATMAAVGFTGPIFVTVGAVLFLGERVHRRRWTAVAIGFIGMLVVVRPGLAAIGPGMAMAIASVPLVAGSNLVAKKVSSRDTPAVVVFWQSLIGALFFMPFGLWFWQTPSLAQVELFVSAGLFGTLGYFFLTWSYRLLDISAMQPITFLGIVWAAVMDVVLWGKTADTWTFVGAAIIVAATSYIARREALMARGR